MKPLKMLFTIAIAACLTANSLCQTATIRETVMQLNTYPFSDPDPVPVFGKIYPYFSYKGYSANGMMQGWKMIEMENDYIKLWVAPEIGGKIWGAIEKATGKEFIYFNHSVKFRDVAMRGPWTSGGIEINFSIIGHAPTTSNPVDYFTRKNDDGSVSCFVGATDLPSHTRWYVEINLPPDKAYFTTRSVWDNPTMLPRSYYHWMNVGVKTAGNLEYTFPGNHYLGHDGLASSWPIDAKGRQINFYEKNNFGSYKSYHVFGEATGFYGGYWHDDDFGFVHYSTYDDKPGKKVWIWGLSDEGMIWEDLLTDKDGQYTEVQAGRLFNQASPESSLTPFKNRDFLAGSTDEFTEFWFPVKQTKGLKWASPEGSLNLQDENGRVTYWFCPVKNINATMEVKNGGRVIDSRKINAKPLEVISGDFSSPTGAKGLSFWLNGKEFYDTDRSKYTIQRPVTSPPSFPEASVYGNYLKGKEQERMRLFREAEASYNMVLDKEPYYVPALTGIARLLYLKMDYQGAMQSALKALSVDTYDGEANMIYGLAGLVSGDTLSAIDGFSIAAGSPEYRSAAYNGLARVYSCNGDFEKVLSYSEKSLVYNAFSSEAKHFKILALRKLGLDTEFSAEIASLEHSDPLDHFSRVEKYLKDSTDKNRSAVQNNIHNEFPVETFLEHALWYLNNNQLEDALKTLGIATLTNPEILLWTGYLQQLTGNSNAASENLTNAINQKPDMVFPFRAETLKPLAWGMRLSDDWKLKYYAGLIYMNAGDVEKGKEFWDACGNTPDFFPFYIARSRVCKKGSDKELADLETALKTGSGQWKAGFEASVFYLERRDFKKAEELAASYFKMNPGNYCLGLQYAKTMLLNGKYDHVIDLLSTLTVLPNEGATEGRIIWRYANLSKAAALMKEKNYRGAIKNITMAREWPKNLGVGKPYDPDEIPEDFMAMTCYTKLRDLNRANVLAKRIIESQVNENTPALSSFLKAMVLKERGEKNEGDRIIQLISREKDQAELSWMKSKYNGEATTAPRSGEEDLRSQLIYIISQII